MINKRVNPKLFILTSILCLGLIIWPSHSNYANSEPSHSIKISSITPKDPNSKATNSNSTVLNLNGTYIQIVSRSHYGMPYTIDLQQRGNEIIAHYINPKTFVCDFNDNSGRKSETKISFIGTLIENKTTGDKISGSSTYCINGQYNNIANGLYMGPLYLNVTSDGNVMSGVVYPPDSSSIKDTMALTRIRR